MHAESFAVPGYQLAYFSVAPDAQGFAFEHGAQTKVDRHRAGFEARLLPCAVLEVTDVLRQPSGGRHDQGPGEFSWGSGRAHTFGHGHAALGAGCQVDVAAHAAGLGDHFESGQLLDQGAVQTRAFADQDDHIGVFEPNRQLTNAFDRVRVHLGWVVLEFGCAVEFADDILVVVKDHNVHARHCALSNAGLSSAGHISVMR